MNRRGQEIEMEHIAALGLGIIGGLASLFVVRGVDIGSFWKVMTFLTSTVAAGFASYFILTKE